VDFRVGPPKSIIHVLFCLLDLLRCATVISPHERIVRIRAELTVSGSVTLDVTINRVNDALECRPRSIRCNIQVPTIWGRRCQRVPFGNILYRLSTLAPVAFRDIACPPHFPNCRNSVLSFCVLIGWPNLIEEFNYLIDGASPSRI